NETDPLLVEQNLLGQVELFVLEHAFLQRGLRRALLPLGTGEAGQRRAQVVIDTGQLDRMMRFQAGHVVPQQIGVAKDQRRVAAVGQDLGDHREFLLQALLIVVVLVADKAQADEQNTDHAGDHGHQNQFLLDREALEAGQERCFHCSTSWASSSSLALICRPALRAACRLIWKRMTLPTVTKPIMPPSRAKSRISLTVRICSAWALASSSSANLASDALMNSTSQPLMAVASLRYCSRSGRPWALSRLMGSSRVRKGSSP